MIGRAVFDCMVFLQATARPNSPSGACIRLAREKRIQLCLSTPILEEVKDVLTRAELRRRFPELTDNAIASLIRDVSAVAIFLDPVPDRYRIKRDPKDEKYLNAAIAGNVAYLVTRDNDLLDLNQDVDFCRKYESLKILDPVEFIKRVDASLAAVRHVIPTVHQEHADAQATDGEFRLCEDRLYRAFVSDYELRLTQSVGEKWCWQVIRGSSWVSGGLADNRSLAEQNALEIVRRGG